MLNFFALIAIVFFSFVFFKKYTTERNKDERRKYIYSWLFLMVSCFVILFSGGVSSEVKHISDTIKTYQEVDYVIKNTDIYSEDNMRDTEKKLKKQIKVLKKNKPPRGSSKDLKEAHGYYVEGITKIKEGILERDADIVSQGQFVASLGDVLLSSYLEENPKIMDKVMNKLK
ncbi:hypothetical protein [Vagococcus fluvialis]|uniref:Uncharacterized protein n=1 Tax=Vagococcus fluvialis TaxID=2738 RepID=A0A7X6I2F7_9ENTE|nr:hypothetical protein [Vagococcus fluvialis]NKC67356.1 hypothetical protein [Vagococcus fluvialis]